MNKVTFKHSLRNTVHIHLLFRLSFIWCLLASSNRRIKDPYYNKSSQKAHIRITGSYS